MCALTEGRSFADQSEGGCDYSNFEGGVIIVNGGVYAAATKSIRKLSLLQGSLCYFQSVNLST